MSNATFSVAFEGDPFENGQIDVRDLAPALLALGDVVRAANTALNGDRADARLKVKANKEGSFEAVLMLDVSWVTDLLDAVNANPDRVVAAEKLADLLLKGGAVVGAAVGGTVGAFRALQWLAGRKPDKIDETPNGTAITVNKTTIYVEPETLIVLEDRPTREAMESFAEKSLEISGLENVKIGREVEEKTLLEAKDRNHFRLPSPAEREPEKVVARRDVWLKIVTSQFKDGYKWRFTDGGERPFTADMEDEDFLSRVLNGDTTLSANDTLHCRVREEQEMHAAGLSKNVYVEKVLEHRRGSTQLRLI